MMSNKQIKFYFADVLPVLKQRRPLRAFILHQFAFYNQPVQSISFIFCTDEYLLQLNRQALNHDYYTDIITFPLHQPGQAVEAEIYISLDRVRENAALHKQSFTTELHRVIFHGLLHLLGCKDKTSVQKKGMRSAENEWLTAYFL